MGGYRLTGFNVPSDDDCMFRLLDNGADRLSVAYLHVIT